MTFYGGYFLGSLLLFLYSLLSGRDWLNKIGLKKGIVYGLLISAVGAFCIIPSVNVGSYELILGSYFIIALGFSLQQTCAQPFVIALGTPETGAMRLNLAGGINSLGTTIGPVAVSYVLFGSLKSGVSEVSLESINSLYLGVGMLFAAMATFFGLSALPALTNDEKTEGGLGALKYPQLVLGMVAIFVYVGVEVAIQSNMGALLSMPEFGGLNESMIAPYISLYWGSLMIGRWTGSIGVFGLKGKTVKLAKLLMPFVAFGVILGVNALNGKDVSMLYPYSIAIIAMALINMVWGDDQFKALTAYSLLGIAGMLVGLFTTGNLAVFAFISGGLACSILWPCIFSIAIAGLGKHTSQGSAFLIMMILGGAIIPPLQGKLADMPSIGIHASYWLAVGCFAYLAFYGLKTRAILAKQGVKLSNTEGSGH